MGSQLLQQALILQQALTSLRERFVRLGRKGRLRAVLVETPVFVHTPGSGLGGVPGSRGKFVWVWSRAYREPAIRVDATGNPVVIATAFVDVQGNPQLNDEGRPIDFSDCGAVRVVQLEGDNTIWDQFKELAADAGHVLETAPSSIRDRFPHETLGLNEPPLRWLCASLTLHGHGYLDRHCLLRPTNRYGSRSTLTWPNLIHSLVICLRKSSTISPTPVRANSALAQEYLLRGLAALCHRTLVERCDTRGDRSAGVVLDAGGRGAGIGIRHRCSACRHRGGS